MGRSRFEFHIRAGLSLLVCLCLTGIANGGDKVFVIEPFLLELDPAPGAGGAFQTFDRPNISSTGVVAFTADTDAATTVDDVIYAGDVLVALEGTPAPGTLGTFSVFEPFETQHQINTAGDVAYIATLRDVPTGMNRAVYVNGLLIAYEGDEPAGAAGVLYEDFGFAGVTDDGRVGYLAIVSGEAAEDQIVYLDGGILYRKGQIVPAIDGLPAGSAWDNFDEIVWNGAGDMMFEGNTTDSGLDYVVRRLNDGTEEVVAADGDVVMAADGEDFLELVLQLSIAEDGKWLVRGNLGVAPSTSDACLITAEGLVVQEGTEVPELEGVVTGNLNGAGINSMGDLLYLADLSGAKDPNIDEGLFLNGELILTDGTQVPGLDDGILFTDIGFEDLYINDNREIVFAANYTGGDGLFIVTIEDAGCPGDGDGDGDGDVDLVDFNDFQICFSGPGGGIGPGCEPFDFDCDGDVDLVDFNEFQIGFTGPM
jgi:hypothetical protein